MTDTSAIAFLSSTTTTRTRREADGDTKTTVEHTARFAVGDLPTGNHALADMTHQYGKQIFRPQFVVADWGGGVLKSVRITGPRVLTSGKLSDAGLSQSREVEYRSWGADSLDRTKLPEALVARLAAYETEVSTIVAGLA